MVYDGESNDEVNKTAEDMVKRGSVLQGAGGADEYDDVITDGRRHDGLSEANLPKSNCKFHHTHKNFTHLHATTKAEE